jgi:hypothetical protein
MVGTVCQFEFLQPEFLEQLGDGTPGQMRLRRLKVPGKVVYASAIAHPIALQRQQPLLRIAHRIAAELTAWLQAESGASPPIRLPLPRAALSQLLIYARDDGLVCVEVGDRALALWLDSVLLPLAAAPPAAVPLVQAGGLFQIQYAHARCCSLLQLAHSTGRITLTLEETSAHPEQWCFVPPEVPWLTAADRLVFVHPAEWQLVGALFSAAEDLQMWQASKERVLAGMAETVRSTEGRSGAEVLAREFLRFHRDRPLFAQSESGELRLAQFGLLLATQRLLNTWLNRLESVSPSAL